MLVASLILAAQLAACTLHVALTRDATGLSGVALKRRHWLEQQSYGRHGAESSEKDGSGSNSQHGPEPHGPESNKHYRPEHYGFASNGRHQPASNGRRRLPKRHGLIDLEAVNDMSAGGYYAEMGIGTPPQRISFLVDTGSSDTWVNSVDADLCRDTDVQRRLNLWCEPAFNPNQSSSLQTIDSTGFSITYLDHRSVHGAYISDTLSLAAHSLPIQLGLALNSTRPTGIMGLGLRANLASSKPYPTLLDALVAHGIITTPVFSLCLGDLTAKSGSLLFGGIDSQKFIGRLVSLPMLPDTYPESFSPSSSSSSSPSIRSYAIRLHTLTLPSLPLPPLSARAILDSGSTISLLPALHASLIHSHFHVHSLPNLATPLVDCALRNSPDPLSFSFSPPATIRVSLSNIIIDTIPPDIQSLLRTALPPSWRSVCVFAISSADDYAVGEPDFVLLGDSFLRSAYVVYDLANRQLAIAQANPRPSGSNVIALEANATSLPNIMGVDESVAAPSHDSDLLILISALAIILLVTTFLPE